MPSSRSSFFHVPVAFFLTLSIASGFTQPPEPVPSTLDEKVANEHGGGISEDAEAAAGGEWTTGAEAKPIVPIPEEAPAADTPAAEPLMTTDFFLPNAVPAVRPPRGTLGITYLRHSHPVPDDKHPRLGMLAVRDKQRFRVVQVRGMSGLRLKNGAWLFESDRPLDPGVSQVVCVEAKDHLMDVAALTKRYVRLIPGRIVYLDFSDPAED